MEAPLALVQSARQSRDTATMLLVEYLEQDVRRVNAVHDLYSNIQTELALELHLTTRISHYTSMLLAGSILERQWEEYDDDYDLIVIHNAMEQRVHRRKLGALVFNQLIPGVPPEQYMELQLYFFGHQF